MENEKILESITRMNKEFRDVISEIDDESEKVDTFISKIDSFKQNLCDFLLTNKSDIEKLYSYANDNKTKNVQVTVINTCELINKYKDYFNGLISYMKDLSKKSNVQEFNDDDTLQLISVLKKSIVKDEDFPSTCIQEVELPFKDAVENIECILELKDYLEILKSSAVKVVGYPIKGEEVKKFANHLVFSSINNFIATCYFNIRNNFDIMYNVVLGKKENSNPVIGCSDEHFKMF